jgi:hypothetical protein
MPTVSGHNRGKNVPGAVRPLNSPLPAITRRLPMRNIHKPSPSACPISAEEWRDVVGFEAHYDVSSHGRVRRKETGRILRPWIAGSGYYYVELRGVNRKKRATVHALVAEAFHGPRPSPRHEVAHWDGIATHNSADNLRWATRAENIQDQRRHGTLHAPVMQGAAHPRAKLKNEDVLRIRRAYSGQRGQLTEMAARFAVDRSTIKRVAVGAGWTHL